MGGEIGDDLLGGGDHAGLAEPDQLIHTDRGGAGDGPWDAHDGPVQDSTWHLFRIALQTTGRVPVLIEWDSQLPEWPALMEQARMAEQAMNDGARETHHAHG